MNFASCYFSSKKPTAFYFGCIILRHVHICIVYRHIRYIVLTVSKLCFGNPAFAPTKVDPMHLAAVSDLSMKTRGTVARRSRWPGLMEWCLNVLFLWSLPACLLAVGFLFLALSAFWSHCEHCKSDPVASEISEVWKSSILPTAGVEWSDRYQWLPRSLHRLSGPWPLLRCQCTALRICTTCTQTGWPVSACGIECQKLE